MQSLIPYTNVINNKLFIIYSSFISILEYT